MFGRPPHPLKPRTEETMADIQNIGITPNQLDENGYLTVWSNDSGEWIKRSPIDAKEGIAFGSLSMTAPSDSGAASEPMSDDAVEDRLVAMTKTELRQMCVDEEVAFTAADTKTSLIQRLLVKGVTFN
jgi:hypothetical protein